MDNLRARFATLDRAPVPDLRARIEARAVELGSIRLDRPVTRPAGVRPHDLGRPRGLGRQRSTPRLLAAAALIVALVVGAALVGSGMVTLPTIFPAESTPARPTPSSVAVPPTASANAAVWMSGQELMDHLSTAYAATWVSTGTGSGTVFTAGNVHVVAPLDSPAHVSIEVDLRGSVEAARIRVGQVAGLLAPDVVPWLEAAVTKAINAAGATSMSNRTNSGGQVIVTRIDERQLSDWSYVTFVPEPLPLRGPAAAGSGAVAYLNSGAVWLMNPDGTEPGRVPVSSTAAYGVRALLGWSADGNLFYETHDGSAWVTEPGWEVARRLGGSSPLALCPTVVAADNCQANLDEAAVSPDGHRIAYSMLEGGELDISSIAVFDLATSIVTRLDSTRATAAGACTARSGSNGWVQWSPDGSRLTFERQGMGPKVGGRCQSAIFAVSADGSDLRRLSAPDLQAYRPRWSPDGAHIAFFSPLGDVYTVRPDGSQLLRLTTDGSSMWPFWTRDGRIVFVRRASPNLGTGELWVVEADGRGATQLDVSVAALTAVGCIVCPYPDPPGIFPADGRLDLAFWQPNPGGSR